MNSRQDKGLQSERDAAGPARDHVATSPRRAPPAFDALTRRSASMFCCGLCNTRAKPTLPKLPAIRNWICGAPVPLATTMAPQALELVMSWERAIGLALRHFASHVERRQQAELMLCLCSAFSTHLSPPIRRLDGYPG